MPLTALLDTEIIVGQCLSDAEYRLHMQMTGRHDEKRCLGIRNKWRMWIQSTANRVVIQTRASGVEHSAEEVRRKRFDAIMEKAARLNPMAFYFGAVLLLQAAARCLSIGLRDLAASRPDAGSGKGSRSVRGRQSHHGVGWTIHGR